MIRRTRPRALVHRQRSFVRHHNLRDSIPSTGSAEFRSTTPAAAADPASETAWHSFGRWEELYDEVRILVRRAKLRTVRSVFLLPTCRVTPCFHRSRSICRRLDRRSARLKATYVPTTSAFHQASACVEMIERALAAGVPFRWVAADSVYGVGDIERNLHQAGKGYVLASTPIIGLHHGASRNGLPAPPRRSPRRSDDRTGGVYRPAPEPKDHDCMTGATSN